MTQLTRFRAVTKRNTRRLRREMTETERRLWQHLRERQLGGYKFRRQHPLGRYVVDFVCLEARLVIEADGGQHGERVEDDRLRTEWLEARGFRLARFWNHDVLNHPEEVKAVIWRALSLGVQPPIPTFPPARGKEPKNEGILECIRHPPDPSAAVVGDEHGSVRHTDRPAPHARGSSAGGHVHSEQEG